MVELRDSFKLNSQQMWWTMMGLGNLPEGEEGDGVRGAVPMALTRHIFLEKLKDF